MLRKILFVTVVVLLIVGMSLSKAQGQVDNCQNIKDMNLSQIERCKEDLGKALDLSLAATKPLESQLVSLQSQINEIKDRVTSIEQDVAIKKKNIDTGYKNLAQQEIILGHTIRNMYIKNYYNSPLLIFLSAPSASEMTQILAYQKATADQDKAVITNIALSIQDLETKKQNLEDEQSRLTALKTGLDAQSAKLAPIVAGAKAYQSNLSTQIAELSAQQQAILTQRLANLNIPLFAYNTQGGCSSDLTNGKDPGFGGGFGFFTYGVPNRVGLSQYGAWGRAKAGQDYSQILQAYYNYDSISGVDQNIQIHIQGNGIDETKSLEEYVKRIYEVPDSWADNNLAALKAQAIAVRSYVLAYTNKGQGAICPTDQCQVYQTNPKGGNWEQAVNATAGQTMIQGGNPIKAWFSSTHGGYIHSSSDIGWSGTSWTKSGTDASGNVASFADLKSNAYDKDSPWFYCDWGARSSYGGTAWLKPDEVADIVNVFLLVQKDSGVKEHLYQTDKSNPAGTDTWDAGRVKQELQNRGVTPFNSVSSASVSPNFGNGSTTSISFSGDGGSVTFNGADFKTYFNLRAPASIQIVGPLFNIETR